MHVDEPYVEVAIGRGEPPRAASRLDSEEHADAVLGFDGGEGVADRFVHGRF